MKIKYLLVVAAILVGLSGCKKEKDEVISLTLTAAFDYSRTGVEIPCLVKFQCLDPQATSWRWTFGDGGTSTLKDPAHVFKRQGDFQVTLTVTARGYEAAQTKTIQFKKKENVTADFDISNTALVAPCKIHFLNKSKNAVKYHWNFGDGHSSNSENPYNTYTKAGKYYIQLEVTGKDGKTDKVTKSVTVISEVVFKPIAQFIPPIGIFYAPCDVQFTNRSQFAVRYQWSFGDNTYSTEVSPSHHYEEAGTYKVKLIAYNAKDEQSVKTQNVVILPKNKFMVITGFTVTNLNWKDASGDSWDFTSGPDLYVQFVKPDNTILATTEANPVMDVTTSSLPVSKSIDEIYISGFHTHKYSVKLWDNDTGVAAPDDFMAKIEFVPKDYLAQQPNVIQLTDGKNKILIDVEWK